MATARHIMEIMIRIVDKFTKPINDLNKGLDKSNKQVKNLDSAIFGFGMSMLFGGGAIKKFFDTLNRSVWKTWKDIIDVEDEFFQKTQQLTAAWEFFKFSLFDALSQSTLFIGLIDAAIQLINWFGKLSDETKIAIVIFAILGTMIATVMMLGGQAVLLFIGIIGGLKAVGIASILPIVGYLLVMIGASVILFAIWSSGLDTNHKKFLTLVAVIAAVIAGMVIFGGVALSVLLVAVGALIAVLAAFWIYRDEVVRGLQVMWASYKWMFNVVKVGWSGLIRTLILEWSLFKTTLSLGWNFLKLGWMDFVNGFVDGFIGGINIVIGELEKFVNSLIDIRIPYYSFNQKGIAYYEPFRGASISLSRASTTSPFSEEDVSGVENDMLKDIEKIGGITTQLFDMPEIIAGNLAGAFQEYLDDLVGIQIEYEQKKAEDENSMFESISDGFESLGGMLDQFIENRQEDVEKQGEQVEEQKKTNDFLSIVSDLLEQNNDITESNGEASVSELKSHSDLLNALRDESIALYGSPKTG
jgi:hypothetical protein